MSILFWLCVILLTIVAGSFAVSNNISVDVGLWPLPSTLEAPLYLVAFALLLIGFAVGLGFAWLGYGNLRSAYRARGREIVRLQERIAAPIQTPRSLTTV